MSTSTTSEPLAPARESTELQTLGVLYCALERRRDRSAALKRWADGAWQQTPNWRFCRQVVRAALYLNERAGTKPGDRIALVSTLRPEWGIAQWAACTQGAVAASIDPDITDSALIDHLAALEPQVAIVENDDIAERLLAHGESLPSLSTIVTLDGTKSSSRVTTWSEALDLGGTLDTAERASTFRKHARSLQTDAPALGYAQQTSETPIWRFLSHRDVVHRVREVWARARVASGDVAYVCGPASCLIASIAFLAFTADAYTEVILGNVGREHEEIATTRPHKIVAARDALGHFVDVPSRVKSDVVRRWIQKARALASRLQRANGTVEQSVRARWLSALPAPEVDAGALAVDGITLEIDAAES